jgi:DNA-directed RNA polymerase subunit M/transcription elongation factor TFIIS
MADIKIKCKKCNKEFLVSEYADEVVCSSCGSSFQAKDPEVVEQVAAEKKQALKERVDSGSEGIPQTLSVNEILHGSSVKKKKNAVQGRFVLMLFIFLIVGCLSSICNYTNILPDSYKYFLSSHMPWLFLVLHVLIVFSAFKDNIFDGILSFLLPPYAYYYLFFKSDEYIFKAIYLGLLMGYGVEYFEFIVEKSRDFVDWGNSMLDGDY